MCIRDSRRLILCILIVHRTEDDIGIVACKLLYIAGCVICLDQADICLLYTSLAEHEPPIIIIEMGTATTMSVIDKNGRYVGCLLYTSRCV